jgi:cytochrome c oxidase subunit 2
MLLLTRISGFTAATSAAVSVLSAGAMAWGQALDTVGAPVPMGLGFQPAVTQSMQELVWLDTMLLWVITAISLFVTGLMILVAVRFNARANPTPAKFTHHTALEVGWTLIPVVILVVIGSYTLPALFRQQDFSAVKADVVIKATGNQWYWSYEYPNVEDPAATVAFDSFMLAREDLAANGYADSEYLLATDTAVVVPINKVVLMQVTASDVIHAWKIPAFGVMQDAVPGRTAQLWFKAEREGVYFGQCSELCGKDHSYMPITVKVVSQEAYDKWIEGAKTGNLALASN